MAIFGTGVGVGDSYATVLLTFPSVDWFRWNIAGAINQMTLESNWSEDGDVAVSFAVEEAKKTLESMIFMAFNPIPPGLVQPFAGGAAPDGWLMCDGGSYSTDDYPELFAVTGYTFGGAGSSFGVPDLRGQTVIGASTTYPVAAAGGQSTVQLTTSEMPSHSHTDLGHSHTYSPPGISVLVVAPGEAPVAAINLLPGFTGSGSANLTNTGGDGSHENMQPYIALSYIIYAGR